MTLQELLTDLSPLPPLPAREIHAVTDHSAHADADSLFVCIKGARVDGHTLARDAYDRGCRTFVAEYALSLPSDACVIEAPDTRRALATLACRFYSDPSHKMRLIGITGTKGKTTTAHLLCALLNRCGIPCGYIGTNGITSQNVNRPTRNTTPDPLTLQSTLSDMQKSGVQAVVIEVSSQALMQERVAGTHFDTVAFTNLSLDHVGTSEHASFTDYRDCKRKLFLNFDARHAVWNTDSPYTAEMRAGCRIPHQITCSREADADFRATAIRPFRTPTHAGIAFDLIAAGDTYPVTLPLVGECNVENALLAAAIAHSVFDLPAERVSHELGSIRVAGRSEWIPLPNGAAAVIDYAHNGDSLRSILSSLRAYAPHRLICLFGSVGERSQLRRAELGRVAAELADLCVLTSDNPGTEAPEAIIEEIAAAIAPTGTPCVKIPDRQTAIEQALTLTQNGDILLLAGKGHEEYQLIGKEKRPFSERLIIAEILQKRKEGAQAWQSV